MPVIVAALLVIVLVLLASVLLIPITIVQRYRAGRARRRARAWLAGVNAAGIAFSTALFLAGAAVTNVWVESAFLYAAAGIGVGMLVGILGLLLTRWDVSGGQAFYTPNAWLVLTVTVAVAIRIGIGVWRSWHAWEATAGYGEWLASAGVDGSLAAGGAILGYYFVYWIGIMRAARRFDRRPYMTSGRPKPPVE